MSLGIGAGLIFSTVLFLLTCHAVYWCIYSQFWPIAIGRVTGHCFTLNGGRHDVGRVAVKYTFVVNSEEFQSDRISVGSFDVNKGAAALVFEQYPVGKEVFVRDNPAAPREAVLEPGRYAPVLMIWVVGLFFVVVFSGAALGYW